MSSSCTQILYNLIVFHFFCSTNQGTVQKETSFIFTFSMAIFIIYGRNLADFDFLWEYLNVAPLRLWDAIYIPSLKTHNWVHFINAKSKAHNAIFWS